MWVDFFVVVNLEIFQFLCTKSFRNLFRNPWPLWDPINSCSVNAFLCKLYYFEFLKGFVRPELLGLVWFVFKSLQPSEICPGCWWCFIFLFGLQIFADSSSGSLAIISIEVLKTAAISAPDVCCCWSEVAHYQRCDARRALRAFCSGADLWDSRENRAGCVEFGTGDTAVAQEQNVSLNSLSFISKSLHHLLIGSS